MPLSLFRVRKDARQHTLTDKDTLVTGKNGTLKNITPTHIDTYIYVYTHLCHAYSKVWHICVCTFVCVFVCVCVCRGWKRQWAAFFSFWLLARSGGPFFTHAYFLKPPRPCVLVLGCTQHQNSLAPKFRSTKKTSGKIQKEISRSKKSLGRQIPQSQNSKTLGGGSCPHPPTPPGDPSPPPP